MIEINQLQILGYLVLKLNPVQEDPIHRGILDSHLDNVRVVHKLHKGLANKRLQGFKLELLIVKLRHCVVLQVDLVVFGLELVLEGTVGLASELVKHLSVHLRCVFEANEHYVSVCCIDLEYEVETHLLSWRHRWDCLVMHELKWISFL
jgi:hypothetical protein